MSDRPTHSFCLVLHSHLPYVLSHGVWPHGTDWLNEACAETYLRLLDGLTALVDSGLSPKITIGITPVLCEQLAHDAFKNEFEGYLDQKIDAANENHAEFEESGRPHMAYLAAWWRDLYTGLKERFAGKYDRDVIGTFRQLQDAGHIEVITSAATHGYLPLLKYDECVRAQVLAGIQSYRRHFGRDPRGIWLPECAYRPRYQWASPLKDDEDSQPVLRQGIEEILADAGIRYFVVDAHLLRGGKPVGVYVDRFEALQRLWGQFADQYRPGAEDLSRTPHLSYVVASDPGAQRTAAIFVRDPDTALQVWSGEHGYPGDPWYLDFHKKHYPGGHRLWRVTDPKADLGEKLEYVPDRVGDRVDAHARHFVQQVQQALLNDPLLADRPGVLCAPFDAELFGHWWFEGTDWIQKVVEQFAQQDTVRMTTCSEYLDESGPGGIVGLPEGSWGEGGFHWIWLNEWNEWTWHHVYECERRMLDLAEAQGWGGDTLFDTMLCQLGRELLLLESSDWQFLISTWSARDYAENRVSVHYGDFTRLANIIEEYQRDGKLSAEDRHFAEHLARRDSLFPDITKDLWRKQ